MRIFSGWLGICCTVVGSLSVVFYSEIPEESHLFDMPGYIILTAVGIVLMYIGRRYLLAWLGIISSDSND